jgi:Cell division protein 48 (CDC48), N-terminal domain/AAA+ lid domain
LKFAEAEQRDVGRKIARIDPAVVEKLNITSGDALELSSLGKKTTVLSWPAKSNDKGKDLIRIDGYTRNKLDVGINDPIEVRKIETKDARSITLAPTEPLRIVGAEEYLAEISHGFVGADLQALAKETALRALRRVLPEIDLSSESIPGILLKREYPDARLPSCICYLDIISM